MLVVWLCAYILAIDLLIALYTALCRNAKSSQTRLSLFTVLVICYYYYYYYYYYDLIVRVLLIAFSNAVATHHHAWTATWKKTLKPLHKAEGHKNPPWRMMLRCALTLLFVKVDCVYLTSWIIMILMHYVLLNVYAKDPTIKGSWSGSLKRCAIWRTSGAHQY